MALSKQGIKPQMEMKYRMEGNVAGHPFVITGHGIGKPYEGEQVITLQVDEGGPLPFSVDVLSAVFLYGNRCFTKYPSNIVDYFKNSCPAGYKWERSLLFEDGAVCTASADIKLSVEENCFYHESKFFGVNFPAVGPVMTKATTNWEPSCEKMTPTKKGILNGDVTMFLLLKDGGRYKCQFHTVHKANCEPKEMPGFHFVQHKLTRTDCSDAKKQKWQLIEHAAACGSSL